uniref:Asn/thr-rich large protein family protein n=1 Tax=uncultured marine thaumarchaeote KM3_65_H02 TaxID=1456226 RepID=A0A075HHX2_9ARCH|nr:asn/thr-rich large protein family protein [uncultured marine thaumarchaeote KM3_65_H02]
MVAPSGKIPAVDQVTVPSSGIFQTKFVFDRQDTGTYTVRATYGSASDTLTFKFTKSQIEPSSSILVFDPIPSKAKFGDTISLTGKLTNDLGKPIAGRTIHLIDGATNKSVFTTSTASDGKFKMVWTVGRGDETYSWYMFFEGDDQFESASSKKYSGVATSIYLTTELYFQPLANKIESGQTVKFSGQLSSGGVPLAGKTIYIKDDVTLDTDRVIKTVKTNSNGEFTATWKAIPRIGGGSYDFYAIFEGDAEANKVRSATYSVYVSVIQVFEQIRVYTEKTVFEVGDALRVYGTATPNEKLQVALMDSNQNVISQKTISVSSTGSYDTVLLTWKTSIGAWPVGFGEYTVIVWSQVDERYDYSYVSFVKSEPETYQTKISLNRPPSSVVLNQQITFTGKLQTVDGKPLGSTKVGIATISEYTQTAESIATGVTDSTGRFSITWTAEHTRSSATMPVYAYFVGSQVFEHSVSNSYSITIEKPTLSVTTEKFSYETGESLKVYGYANSNDRINLVLKSPTGQVVLSKSNIPTGSLGLFSHTFDTLPSNLSVGTYTVTATSSFFGTSASTKIAIESDAVFETIDIVGVAYYTSYSGYVEYPLEGIKTVLTTGASQRVDYTDASGNFEFDSIKFDSQVDYLLHFEMTDGKSFNFVDSQIYNIDDYGFNKNPLIIKSNTMRLLLDNTIEVNQFSINLNLNMPDRYDDTDSRYIFKTFDYQTKVVKFYNKVLNERPPLINVFLFHDKNSHYQPTGWNSNTHSVLSGYWQPHIAISEGGSWSGVGMEYTHYAQDYAYQKMYGYDNYPRNGNHLGFGNPSTGDSWTEGVGTFMPAVIAEWYNMPEAGTFSYTDLEDNRYKPNSNYFNYGTSWLDEEYSIATLLWDLYDKRQDGENITLGINEIWNLIKAYDDFENHNPKYDYKKKWDFIERFSSNERHIKYFKDFYEFMSDYDINHNGRVDSSDQKIVDDIFALHGIPNGLTDPKRSDRV